jgi:HPt (histidine-containing phosphotransfer) domain-containing protein
VLVDYRLDHPTLGTPFMRGTELLPRLRTLGYAGKIVVKSANDSSADLAHFRGVGADDALSKGLSVHALGRELARILAHAHARATGNGHAVNGGSIDVSVLGEYTAPAQRHMVLRFCELAPGVVAAASAAAAGGDAERVWGCVHRLKGMAAYVGAVELGIACEAMRDLPAERHSDALTAVRASLDAALDALAPYATDGGKQGGFTGGTGQAVNSRGGVDGGETESGGSSAPAESADPKGAEETPSPVNTGFPRSASSVADWLSKLNLAQYGDALKTAGITSVTQLPTLTNDALAHVDLRSPGVRRRLLNASATLRSAEGGAPGWRRRGK